MTVDELESYDGASGTYTSETIESKDSIGAIIQQIEKSLPAFSDLISPANADIKFNEEKITQEIVLYFAKEQHLIKVIFIQENREPNKRRVDIGIYPHERGVYEIPYFVLEAKRLPAPKPNSRQKEYVSYIENTDRKGGIERFKLGLHGSYLTHCGMIGYVEDKTFVHWHKEVNSWIKEIANAKSDPDVDWSIDEQLMFAIDKGKYAVLDSKCHRRQNGTDDEVQLSHFWVKII